MNSTAQATDPIVEIAEHVPDEVVQVVEAVESAVNKAVAPVQVDADTKPGISIPQPSTMSKWLFWGAAGFGAWLIVSGLHDLSRPRQAEGDEG